MSFLKKVRVSTCQEKTILLNEATQTCHLCMNIRTHRLCNSLIFNDVMQTNMMVRKEFFHFHFHFLSYFDLKQQWYAFGVPKRVVSVSVLRDKRAAWLAWYGILTCKSKSIICRKGLLELTVDIAEVTLAVDISLGDADKSQAIPGVQFFQSVRGHPRWRYVTFVNAFTL